MIHYMFSHEYTDTVSDSSTTDHVRHTNLLDKQSVAIIMTYKDWEPRDIHPHRNTQEAQ